MKVKTCNKFVDLVIKKKFVAFFGCQASSSSFNFKTEDIFEFFYRHILRQLTHLSLCDYITSLKYEDCYWYLLKLVQSSLEMCIVVKCVQEYIFKLLECLLF